jgi:hypothetical protein
MTTAVGNKVANAAKFLLAVLAMITGVTKNFTAKMTLTVGGQSMTQAAILAQLASIKGLFDAVTAAKNAAAAAVTAKNAGLQQAKQFMADLKKAVEAQFGSNSPQLLDFGISLPKPRPPRTAAEKAASAGLAVQTRAVRQTMGKVQKEDVTVSGKPGVVIVGPSGTPLVGVAQGAPIPPTPVPVPAGSSTAAATPAPAGSAAPATPATGGTGK